ncbi:uncharacterized protein [Rutidosis leptorrhynchoides]|uniref:uncharacterized protein n=1 Tax=Rutidosis leptorrhynchoides TaxID=125765 RepID=UPI003A99EF3C
MSSASSSSEEFFMQVLDIINSEALESENEAESSNTRRYIEREHETAHPTTNDIKRLNEAHEDLYSLPGMMGSIDCMHWAWGKCPVAWKGQFTRGAHKVSTIKLESVASYNNWIWHAFFGVAGSNNDLNVLNASNLFNSMLNEEIEDIPFTVNGVEYKRGYYLADSIYPGWASFVKAFSSANDEKRKYFSKKEEAASKDVERTFGILQRRWHILQQPSRTEASML